MREVEGGVVYMGEIEFRVLNDGSSLKVWRGGLPSNRRSMRFGDVEASIRIKSLRKSRYRCDSWPGIIRKVRLLRLGSLRKADLSFSVSLS